MAQGWDDADLPPPETPTDVLIPFALPPALGLIPAASCLEFGIFLIYAELVRVFMLTLLIQAALHFDYDKR
jgi:hypothetical protein